MSEETQKSPQRKDSFVQTDIAGAVDLPFTMEDQDVEAAGENSAPGYAGEAGGEADSGAAQVGEDTLPDVSESEFLRGDFVRSTPFSNQAEGGETNNSSTHVSASDDSGTTAEGASGESARQTLVGEDQSLQSRSEDASSAVPEAAGDASEQAEGSQSGGVSGEPSPHADVPEVAISDEPGPVPASDAIGTTPLTSRAGLRPTFRNLADDFRFAPEPIPELPTPPGAEVSGNSLGTSAVDFIDLPDLYANSVFEGHFPEEACFLEGQAAELSRSRLGTVGPGSRQELEVQLTAHGDPECVSVNPCDARDASSVHQTFRSPMTHVSERRCVSFQPDSQLLLRRTEECSLQNRDTPSSESIYHDALSTPSEDPPLMRTTIRLTITARAKKDAPQPSGSCGVPQATRSPCQQRRRTCPPRDREGQLAQCAANSVLRLMGALEESGVVDRSARMVLSPRGLVVCLRPSDRREPSPSASGRNERTLRSSCQRHSARQLSATQRSRLCSRAAQTETMRESTPNNCRDIESGRIRDPDCTCYSNDLHTTQSSDGNDQFYSLEEICQENESRPPSQSIYSGQRPPDDFMNPFPCPYYPACIEAATRERQAENRDPECRIQDEAYTINPTSFAQPCAQQSQPCEGSPEHRILNESHIVNPASFAQPCAQQNQPCEDLSEHRRLNEAYSVNPASFAQPCAQQSRPCEGSPEHRILNESHIVNPASFAQPCAQQSRPCEGSPEHRILNESHIVNPASFAQPCAQQNQPCEGSPEHRILNESHIVNPASFAQPCAQQNQPCEDLSEHRRLNEAYSVNPASFAQPCAQQNQPCENLPEDRILNETYIINHAPCSQPCVQQNQQFEDPPDSGYASSTGEVQNMPHITINAPTNQPGIQQTYSFRDCRAPGPMNSSDQVLNTRYTINDGPFYQNAVEQNQNQQDPLALVCTCPSERLLTVPTFNDAPYTQNNCQQIQQDFIPNEGYPSQQSLQLGFQFPSEVNFGEVPGVSSMRRDLNRCNPSEMRMIAPWSLPQNPTENRLFVPRQRQCQMGTFSHGLATLGSRPCQRAHEDMYLSKKDSVSPLRQEITRLGQIINSIMEVAIPLTEYFNKSTTKSPALMNSQSSVEVTARSSTEIMNRPYRCLGENESSSQQGRLANGTSNPWAQLPGICSNRSSSSLVQNEARFEERVDRGGPSMGERLNRCGTELSARHSMQMMTKSTASTQCGSGRRPVSYGDDANNRLWARPSSTYSREIASGPARRPMSTSGVSCNRLEVPDNSNRCTKNSWRTQSQSGRRSQTGTFGPTLSEHRQSRVCEDSLPENPCEDDNDISSEEAWSPDTYRPEGGHQHSTACDRCLGTFRTSTRIPNNHGTRPLSTNIQRGSANGFNSGDTNGLRRRNQEGYNMESDTNHVLRSRKVLPAVCDKHREQASRKGFI